MSCSTSKQFFLRLASMVAASVLLAANAPRCCVRSPLPPPPICERFWGGDAIALVDVTEINEHGHTRRVQLRTVDVFRGQVPAELTISDQRTDCGVSFPAKARYLAWLWQTKTGKWQGYADLGDDAAEDLKFAQSVKNLPPEGRIFGTLDKPRRSRILAQSVQSTKLPDRNGVTLVATSGSRRYSAAVSHELAFDFPALAPGKYEVQVEGLPSILSVDLQNIEVHAGGCNELILFSASSATVAGHVTGAGQPPRFAQISLVPVDQQRNLSRDASKWVLTEDSTGSFAFKHVDPGQYMLAFELNHSPTLSVPYASRFYPQASDEKQAAVISIGAGEAIDNLKFDVGDEVQRRHVRVRVVWADGSPAENATAYLRDAHNPYSSVADKQTLTDARGQALLEGFINTDYDVAANAVCKGHSISKKVQTKVIPASVTDAFVTLTVQGHKCSLFDWQSTQEDK